MLRQIITYEYPIQVQDKQVTVRLLPAALSVGLAYTSYKVVTLLTWPKKIPGAEYPDFLPHDKVSGGRVAHALFGHLAEENTYEEEGKSGVYYYERITSQHQRPMCMFTGMGTTKMSPAHPDDMEYILTKNAANYPKTPIYGIFQRLLGDGLFSQLDEQQYPAHRQECAKAFAPKSLKKIADQCVSHQLGELLERLKAADGKTVEMNREMLRVGMHITSQAAFRLEDKKQLEEVSELYDVAIKNLWGALRFVEFGDKVMMRKENAKLAAARAELDKIADKVLSEIQNLPAPEEGQGKALIDYLAHTTKMSHKVVLDNILTFLFAGSDTTSITMFFVLYHLAKNPGDQEKLFEELADALSLGQHPTLDDIKGCDFLRKVCKESLRLNSPAGGVAKEALEDDVLPVSKQFVPKGCTMDLVFISAMRYKELWGEDADQFRPSRWDDPTIEERIGPNGYIPFSIGRRNCPGKDFAINEMHLVVATVIRNFKVSWPEGEKEPFLIAAPTIQAKYPVNLGVQSRQD